MEWLDDDDSFSGLVVFPSFPPPIIDFAHLSHPAGLTYVASVASGKVENVPVSEGIDGDIVFP